MAKSVEECLKKLSQDSLKDLGFRLLVMPPPDRDNKAAWITLLCDALNGPDLDLLLCLTMEEWNALRNALLVNTEEGFRFVQVKDNEALSSAMSQLQAMGLSWRDQRRWHVQPRVLGLMGASKADWDTVELADKLYAAMQGYLRLYGMMPAQDMVDRVTPLMAGVDLPLEESTGDFILGVWRRRNGLPDILMGDDGLWLLSPDLEEVEPLYAELHQPKMLMKPYAPYSLEEASAIGHGTPPGRCDAYDELLNFYQTQGIDRVSALNAIDESVLAFQQNRLEDVMIALVTPLAGPPTTAQLRLMKLVYLRAPSWRLKGSCAEDMLPPGARVSKRVRQDDPCPCGSGRKYKHCCGRLQ